MGKIVKYCSSCDEGFAEKFGFCPNCGAGLQAFEMNPVEAGASPVVAAEPPAHVPEPAPVMTEPAPEPPEFIAAPVPMVVAPPVVEAVSAPAIPEFNDPVAPQELVTEFVAATPEPEAAVIEEPVVEPIKTKPAATIPVAKAAAATAPVFVQKTAVNVDRVPVSLEAEHDKVTSEGGFYVTVMEEKNVGQRSLLFLGATVLMVTVALGATVVSLFQKDIGIGAIGDETSLASLIDEVPMTVEEEKQQKKDKDAGGGGGGGREEKDPTTQGDLADQSKNPTRPPDAKVFRSDNFELKMPPPQTEGNKTYDKKFDRWGDPNGRFASFSNGTGSGGGQGSGTGTGQGSGRGTGNGSGNGSGSGGGLGNGNGNGTGDGESSIGAPPPKPVGVTQGIKILSKPRPGYTDSARQANIQGTVILRVTFLASGQVGGISPIKGLGSGLTEQAIAAARRIAFEPAKTNGVAQSVTKQIEYTFSIY